MNKDVYELVTVNDGKSDTTAVIKVLSEIASGCLTSNIRLLDYCGVVRYAMYQP